MGAFQRHSPFLVLAVVGAITLVAATACAPTTPTGAGVPRSGPASPHVSASEPAPDCPASGALVTAERGDAAMGYREMTLHLRNCGGSPVQLNGRPDIVVLDEDQQPLDVLVVPSVHYTAAPKPVTVEPGTGAQAVLSWRNTVTNPTVVATNGAFLSIAPVPDKPRQILRLPRPMDLGNTGRLEVSVWL